MQPVELKYSICYPDKEAIQFGNETLNEGDARRLLQDFDFDSELVKPINHYSPSLDFIRLDDRFRLILSGLGNGQLESFMVMFVEPKRNYNSDEFDEGNYRGTESFTKELSIDESFEIFEKFISQEYKQLRSKLKIEERAKLIRQPSPEFGAQYITPEEQYEPDSVEEPYHESVFENILARVGGPLLSLFFGGLTFVSIQGKDSPVFITLLFGSLFLVFLVGSILFEIKQHK